MKSLIIILLALITFSAQAQQAPQLERATFRGDCERSFLDADIREWNNRTVLWVEDQDLTNALRAHAHAPRGPLRDRKSCFMQFMITIPANHRLTILHPNVTSTDPQWAGDFIAGMLNYQAEGTLVRTIEWSLNSATASQHTTSVSAGSISSTVPNFWGSHISNSNVQSHGCVTRPTTVPFEVKIDLAAQSGGNYDAMIELRRLNFYLRTQQCRLTRPVPAPFPRR